MPLDPSRVSSMQTLAAVKYGAIATSALLIAGIVSLMILAAGKDEDITGIVAPALVLTVASAVVAIVAAVMQRQARNAVGVLSESDHSSR